MFYPLTVGLDGQFQQQPVWSDLVFRGDLDMDGYSLKSKSDWFVLTLDVVTTDKNPWTTLLHNGSSLAMPVGVTWLFNAHIVARAQDIPKDAGFQLRGVVIRDGSAALVGSKKTTVAKNGSFKVRAVIDTVNDTLALQVKGLKNEDVTWVARLEVIATTG